MEDRVRWTDRILYWIDNTFSQGMKALITWLGVLSLVIILFGAVFITAFGLHQNDQPTALSFPEALWESLVRTLDAGTMGSDTGWGFRLVMLLVTIGGVFVISALIGILANGIQHRILELRKGRSRVIEENHTVILGWSDQVFTILNELVEANLNHKGGCVVILAEKDKVEMEDLIRAKAPQKHIKNGLRNVVRGMKKEERQYPTRIVCRTGCPIDATDLAITRLTHARSIIVLSPRDSDDEDAEVIKSVLAILNGPARRAKACPIIAELRDPRNFAAADFVGRGAVEWVLVGNLVARIIAQTCRQSGLSVVYNDLLDFSGVEMYFSEQPELAGLTFGQALLRFEENALLGIFPHGDVAGRATPLMARLNPPSDTVISSGDKLIVLAEDDDKICLDGAKPYLVQEDCIHHGRRSIYAPEQALILGWNWRAPIVLHELDRYVAPGSTVQIVADLEDFPARVEVEVGRLDRLALSVSQADTTDRKVLEGLDLEHIDHVIVLSYLEGITPQQADARTLITLLHLRELGSKRSLHFSITSEILDVRNRDLASVTRADDFIVSERLVSLMLAQVSENKNLNTVFTDLFNPDGSEIYLKPAENYVPLGLPVNFYTVVESALRQNEVAFGYRRRCESELAYKNFGVRLNPAKSIPVTFENGDQIVVLAER